MSLKGARAGKESRGGPVPARPRSGAPGALAEELRQAALLPDIGLDVGPAQHALLVDQEIGAARVVLVPVEHAVEAADLALEVREDLGLHAVLVLELAQRGHRVDRDSVDL